MDVTEIKWIRTSKGGIQKPIIDYMEELIIEQIELGREMKVCFGTDSQKKSKKRNGIPKYKYAVAIIFEMKSNGYDGKIKGTGLGAKKIYGQYIDFTPTTVSERMLKEVQISINTAMHLAPLLDLYGVPFEIHADVNPDPIFDSNKALNNVVGYIKGMDYNYKVKPNAYAASCAADKIAKS